MPTAKPATNKPKTRQAKYALRVNAYDQTSSLLIALLVMVGASVLGLIIIYFSGRVLSTQVAIPVQAVNPFDSTNQSSGPPEPETPGDENAPEELDPILESKLNQLEGLIAAQAALLNSDQFDPLATMPKGKGIGDPRQAGDGSTGAGGPPEPQRELRFEPNSLQDYAAWMDAIGTELGVLGYDNKVHYASKFSRSQPALRTGEPKDEKRLYFNTAGGPLASLDRQLASKAGLLKHGEIILQFCSNETAQELLQLEQKEAGKRTRDQIRRTIFLVEKRGGRYTFKVDRQEYR